MSQTLQTENKKLWVLVSSLKETTTADDLNRITPSVSALVDQWHARGKFVISGPLDNNKSGLAVFEATDNEAKQLLEEQKQASLGALDSYLYQWNALPFISLLN
jgi:uncharacterized protein YciI